MIVIEIPYWFTAAMLCLFMVMCILGFFIGILSSDITIAGTFIFLLFFTDLISLGLSAGYMSTPINGYEFWGTGRCIPVGGGAVTPCVYPTINPYEQQPLHPVQWLFYNFPTTIRNYITGTISIKQQRI